jgi:aquaporin Z
MNKLFAEFLGTFFFCLVALMSGSAMAAAGALAAMVYALGYVSGGHFNPAVSLAVWMRGQLDRSEMLRFAGVQAAAAVAAVLMAGLLGHKAVSAGVVSFPWFRALVGETLFTFLVAFTWLHVRTARQVMGNTWFGIAVGWVHFAGASAIGHLSAGACNPALGLALVAAGHVPAWMVMIYLLAGLTGGAAAAVAYRLLNPND